MFAYCANNPTNNYDLTGRLYESSSHTGAQAMTYNGGTPIVIPLPYSKHQKKDGLINGQAVFEFADAPFLFGTYANNGCGVIALYNAMQLLDKPQSLGKVEDEVFLNGGMLAGGLMGTEPWFINDYFHSHGITCTGYASFDKLNQHVEDGSIVVFLVLNNKENLLDGLHFMTAQYSDNEYVIYNLYNNVTDPLERARLDSIDDDYAWTYGYIIGG